MLLHCSDYTKEKETAFAVPYLSECEKKVVVNVVQFSNFFQIFFLSPPPHFN